MSRETDSAQRRLMEEVTGERLQLLANGYGITRNRDKRTFQSGWPNGATPEDVAKWARRHKRDMATGIIVQSLVQVMDLDVDDPVTDRIVQAWFDRWPWLADPETPLLVRRGKGHKEAWFFRGTEPYSRMHSHRWVKPGMTEDEPGAVHGSESFGGASARQFGAFGPHTVTDAGEVLVEYRWDDLSPLDVPVDQLPVLSKQMQGEMHDIVDAVLEAAGWTKVKRSTRGENENVTVYDLTDDMHFDTNTDERLSLYELRDRAAKVDGIRCSASWLEGPSAVNRQRCLVSINRAGHLAIWETASGVTHVEKSGEPGGQLQAGLQRLGALAQARGEGSTSIFDRPARPIASLAPLRPAEPRLTDSRAVVAEKLLKTYAWCENRKTPVVPIYTDDVESGSSLVNFRLTWVPTAEEEIGPNGGRKMHNPVDDWVSDPRRITVEGLQMRPDMPRPTFEEGGKRWVNTYHPPAHDAEGGDAAVGVEFMEQLFPHEVERSWTMQWLAHKVRYPHIPGPCLVMVAHGRFGTGRGTFMQLVGKLLGESYVKDIPYSMVAGKTYQSQYTDWMPGSLAVFVNESSEAEAGTSRYQTKHNVYERLKEIIDPKPMMRTYVTRGKAPLKSLSCTTFLIATNHKDALPIAPDDRRFAIVRNGDPREAAYWERLLAWMDNPANVAAFREWLLSIDLTGYSPFAAPPPFEGKLEMITSSKSDLDNAFDEVVEAMPSAVMTISQIVDAMREARRVNEYEYPDWWKQWVKRAAANQLHRVGVRDGVNWQIKHDGKKYAVYARSAQAAAHWRASLGLREEVLKNGALAVATIGSISFR